MYARTRSHTLLLFLQLTDKRALYYFIYVYTYTAGHDNSRGTCAVESSRYNARTILHVITFVITIINTSIWAALSFEYYYVKSIAAHMHTQNYNEYYCLGLESIFAEREVGRLLLCFFSFE